MAAKLPPEPTDLMMINIIKISENWYIGRIRGAAFFGASVSQVMFRYRTWMHEKYPPIAAPRLTSKILQLIKEQTANSHVAASAG